MELIKQLSCFFLSLVLVVPLVVCSVLCSLGVVFPGYRIDLDEIHQAAQQTESLFPLGLAFLDPDDSHPDFLDGSPRIHFWPRYLGKHHPSRPNCCLLRVLFSLRSDLLFVGGYPSSIGK